MRVKTNTFVTDFDEFQKCADIRMRYVGVATPTSTTVGVTRVRQDPISLLKIEAVAVGHRKAEKRVQADARAARQARSEDR